jgi:Mrp family chromosome partitioning ATPase
MKQLHKLFSLLVLAAMLGCATPEQGAYRVIGTITYSVDGAMNGWGDYVRAGLATADDQAKVKAAYERYQSAMRLARVTVATVKSQPEGTATMDAALAAAEAASGQLIGIIQSLLK